ncbi:MAG: LysR substrate-binding domain-containing protein [Gammaproteobacteria bacterium WSBS_2016_MAG_OTU1]
MKLSLLRCLVAVCDNNLRVSAAAHDLKQVQPSVSKSLMELEKQMDATLFVRRGKRIIDITPLCAEVLSEAREILFKCDNIIALKRRYGVDVGDIRIGTTHLQARYLLPEVVRQYREEYTSANIQIFQSMPVNLVQMLENNQVDLIICTEVPAQHSGLLFTDAYTWNRSVIMLPSHPLAQQKLTLKALVEHPLITYTIGFTGRAVMDKAFRKWGLSPDIAVAAADSDVIKTYVRAGIGVGIIAAISGQQQDDSDLLSRSVAHLFPNMLGRMAQHRDKVINDSMQRFTEIFCRHAATLTADLGAKPPTIKQPARK